MPKIAFQGAFGAYSHMACQSAYPGHEVVSCLSFATAMEKVQNGEVELAMIPMDNSSAGRVTDAHQLFLSTPLHIVAEHFEPVQHCLLGVKGAQISDIKTVHSHIQALGQCAHNIRKHKFEPQSASDTANAAKKISLSGDKTKAGIASKLTAEIYGLEILQENFEDFEHNTTRFLVFSKMPPKNIKQEGDTITSLVFNLLHQPASLHRALGCFAEQDVNLLKLESYMDEAFKNVTFYLEVSGHPENEKMRKTLNCLEKLATHLQIKGFYKAHAFRK